ncbi:MAG: hypothetical protein H7Y38_14385 [Armatimonadetes bacterium]|nr:hypothetical protein [Armatimonadota bacterium]
MLRNTIVLATLTLLSIFGVGCGDTPSKQGQDADLVSENPSIKQPKPAGTGFLLPLTPGRTWRTITSRPQQANVGSEMKVMGSLRVSDGRTGTLVRSTRGGKLFRVEVFQPTPGGGLNLLALGENEKKLLVFSPAVPFLPAPVVEGKYIQWNGTARIDGRDYAASAFHRISATEEIKTPFESLITYRLDGIITLLNGSQRIDYPAVMWLVPGKGMAQRRLADRGTLALEVITKF